jgi:hypothetical protein
MDEYQLMIGEDDAVILFEFFERFDDTEELFFVHPAEWIALGRLSAQICSTTSAMFNPKYREILDAARERVARGFEGDVPLLRAEP